MHVTCTHVKVQVLEYRRAGIDTIALEAQITMRKTRAKVFDILGFKGLTMAMYLEKNIYIYWKRVMDMKRFLFQKNGMYIFPYNMVRDQNILGLKNHFSDSMPMPYMAFHGLYNYNQTF